MRRSSVIFLVLFFPSLVFAQRMTREEYIYEYKDLATSEMLRTGIPASIKLAQGLLESNNGNSTLARKGNNHFGIKCHGDWKGRRIRHEDDEKNECFRRYKSVYDSYVDHSDFLKYRSRYAFLFDLGITDYKSWAKGLKKAGYATNRKYADILIRIIEDNELHKYDLLALDEYDPEEDAALDEKEGGIRPVLMNNRIDYVIVRPGDTFESLNEELRLLDFELYKYNNLTPDSALEAGEILYLQPKRNRAEKGMEYHILKANETLYEISQVYGVKLEKLYEKNNLEPGENVQPGTIINLRKRKEGGLFSFGDQQESIPEENDEFRFEFEN